MTPSVRIASLVYPDPGRGRAQAAQHWQRFAELQLVLKRHLPEVTASLFARPLTTADPQGAVDWYSDMAGQPVPLLDLPPDAQDALRGLLADRLQAIARLADALEQREPEIFQSLKPELENLLVDHKRLKTLQHRLLAFFIKGAGGLIKQQNRGVL